MPESSTTKKLAVFGYPLGHTLSPVMYNAAFAYLGLDWHYEAIEVPPEGFAVALGKVRADGYLGLNFTVPHKLAALRLMDEVDSTAQMFEAVNTAVNVGAASTPQLSRFIGHNTDGYGLERALRDDLRFELKAKSVVILGAGGAGQAAALQCAMEGARVLYLVNRTRAKAESLAEKIRSRFPSVQLHIGLPPRWRADLMINATSLGLHPDDPKPIICEQIEGVPFVFDMIYRPAETKFLQQARASGAKTANGLSMLLHQGVRALELWLETHVPERKLHAPVEVMREALQTALARSN
jgi:shikimate dehydrogenase